VSEHERAREPERVDHALGVVGVVVGRVCVRGVGEAATTDVEHDRAHEVAQLVMPGRTSSGGRVPP
jgi:hypothetical protein